MDDNSGLEEMMHKVMEVMAYDGDLLKKYLKDNPNLVSPTFHKVFVAMLPQMFRPEQRDWLEKGADKAKLLRRCIDVGVELAFAGY